MKEFSEKVIELVAAGEVETGLTQILNLLTVANADLKNDAIILRGRLSKLKSDVRKGIIAHEDEVLEFNRVQNFTLELLNDMGTQADVFTPYLNDMDDSIARHSRVESDLEFSVRRKRLELSGGQKDALFARMAYVKERKMPFRIIWVHDYPDSNTSESRLIAALDVESVYAKTSDEAIDLLQKEEFDLIISDIDRAGNKHEGLDFLKRLVILGIRKPFIFYIAKFDDTRGTPPYCFGITNRPNELLHLVMDVMARK
jgi:CheY-like chemotaxis protein